MNIYHILSANIDQGVTLDQIVCEVTAMNRKISLCSSCSETSPGWPQTGRNLPSSASTRPGSLLEYYALGGRHKDRQTYKLMLFSSCLTKMSSTPLPMRKRSNRKDDLTRGYLRGVPLGMPFLALQNTRDRHKLGATLPAPRSRHTLCTTRWRQNG